MTKIKKGLPGLSPVACMHTSLHPENVSLQMSGLSHDSILLHWIDDYDEKKARTYADMQYTVEHGAVCLSVMLTTTITPYTVIERSRKGTGIDYWLGEKDSYMFQKKARLEISGLLKGDDTDLKRRHAAKVKQTHQSDSTLTPVYVSVIEFGTPKALFTLR